MSNARISKENFEENFKQVFNILPNPAYLWQLKEQDFVLIDYNTSIEEFTTGEIKDYTGSKASEFFTEQPEMIEYLRQCVLEKTSFRKEMKYKLMPNNTEKELLIDFSYIIPHSVLVYTSEIMQEKQIFKGLKDSEEILNKIVDQPFLGIAIFQEFAIKFYNRKFSQIIGYSCEEIDNWEPKEFFKIMHPEDKDIIIDLIQKVYLGDNEALNAQQFRIIKDQSNIKWVEIQTKPIMYREQKADLVFIQDITTKKEAEEKLRRSEEKYRLITENVNDLILILKVDSTIEYVNEKPLLKMFGYKSEEIIGKRSREFIHTEFLGKNGLKTADYLKKGNRTIELKVKNKKNIYIPVEVSISLFNDINNIGKQLITVRDISDRKAAEQRLKESEERFRTLTEESFLGVAILQNNLIKYVNKRLAETFGYSIDEAMKWNGGEFLNVIHPEDRKFVAKQASKKQNGQFDIQNQYQFRGIKKNGDIIWLEVFSKTINYGESPADFVTILDITERKNTEQKLKTSYEKLKEMEYIVNNSPGMVFLWQNKEGWPIEFVSENIIKFGYRPEDFYSKQIHYANIIYPDDLNRISEEIRHYSNENINEFNQEYRLTTKSGEVRWIDDRTWIRRDSLGNITHFQGIILDITDRKKVEESLRDAEEKSRLIVDNITEIIYILNQNYKIEYINEKIVHHLLGYTKEELIGKSPLEFIHPDDMNRVRTGLSKGFQKGEGLIEVRFKDKENNYHWFEVRGKLFQDWDGNLKSLSIAREITERKLSEQKLKESEEKYSTLAKISPVGIFYTDCDGNCLYVNERWCEMAGFSSEEALGTGWSKALHPEDKERIFQLWYDSVKKNMPFKTEYRFRRPDGKTTWVVGQSTSIKEGSDRIKGYVGTITDINDLKEADEKLRKSEERYRLISENSGSVVWETDMNLNLKYVGESSHVITAYSAAEAMAMPLSKTMTQESLRKAARIFREEIKIERNKTKDLTRSRSLEIDQIHKNGSIIPCELTFTFLRDDNDKAIGFLGITRDITERKKAEKELRQSEENYREAYDRVNFYKDLFAHDIRNILQIVNSSAELISLQLNGTQKTKDISMITDLIKKQILKANLLIKNIILISELDQKEKPIKITNLSEHLLNSINYIKSAHQERNLDIQLESFSNRIFVEANELLQDVFDNILTNAVKYNENSTVKITIKVSEEQKEGKHIKLEFIDNGIGIIDERKKIIFERGNGDPIGTKGMGLGLSLVKKVISSYNGEIWIENRIKEDYSKGSNFIILLPQ